jgi:Iodothyronine deiodinase
VGVVERMYEKYRGRAAFLTVYIKEAHPQDEWRVAANRTDGVCYLQPKTLEDRLAIAGDFVRRFDYRVPVLVDGMDNRAETLYAGWPERFYIVDESGRIVYKGRPGPFGYHPEEVLAWLERRFGDSIRQQPESRTSEILPKSGDPATRSPDQDE